MKHKGPVNDSNTRTRELSVVLQNGRARTTMSGNQLSKRLAWCQTKVVRAESGKRGPSGVEVAAYLSACGPIDRDEFDHAVELAEEREHPAGHWFRAADPTVAGLPKPLRSLIAAEQQAQSIDRYATDVIPGLLQTEAYARQILEMCSTLPAETIEARVQTRMGRQELLHRRFPPHCSYLIHERALRTVVGSPKLMQEQILKLLLTLNDHCSIRVVPESAGPYGALIESFTLFGHEKFEPTAHTETTTAGIFVEKPESVAIYRTYLTKLESMALTEGQSRSWLAGLASQYDRMEARKSCATTEPGT